MDHSLVWIFLLGAVYWARGARILGIFPTPSISHQLPFQTIMKALAARGHEITVISTDPLKTPVPNYTDVDLSFSYEHFHASLDFTTMDQSTAYELVGRMVPVMNKVLEKQFSSSQLQEFIRSNATKYDLVFLEAFLYQSYHGLIHLVGSPPVIGILSLECLWTVGNVMGNPSNPAFVPEILLSYGNRMTIYERLQNMLFWLWIRYKIYTEWVPEQEAIMRRFFGLSPPPVIDAEKNISLLMLSSNWVFNYPIPLMPTVVTFHSLHIKSTNDTLPKDLQTFLDEAEYGVIYFSLGSNVRSDRMPQEKRHAFLSAFSELPQRILWKWESDNLPGQPPNVKLGKWFPQQDILAHPNIKLFITQCGLQSFQEAVYHGVPMLGIPFIADQKYNAKKIVTEEIGLQLLFHELTKETLLTTIKEMINNSKYRDNIKRISAISKDEPESSLDRAVWWAEYTIRHKGTKHLRSSAPDLAWYQYLLLDIVALIFFVFAITICILYLSLKNVYMYITGNPYKVKSKHD